MKNFVKGMWFNKPHEKAPSFVIGKLSIKLEFSDWLQQQTFDEKGYINLDILMGKSGKPYIAVNEYKKGAAPVKPAQPSPENYDNGQNQDVPVFEDEPIDVKDIPF